MGLTHEPFLQVQHHPQPSPGLSESTTGHRFFTTLPLFGCSRRLKGQWWNLCSLGFSRLGPAHPSVRGLSPASGSHPPHWGPPGVLQTLLHSIVFDYYVYCYGPVKNRDHLSGRSHQLGVLLRGLSKLDGLPRLAIEVPQPGLENRR